jgi:hypothetical protein
MRAKGTEFAQRRTPRHETWANQMIFAIAASADLPALFMHG